MCKKCIGLVSATLVSAFITVFLWKVAGTELGNELYNAYISNKCIGLIVATLISAFVTGFLLKITGNELNNEMYNAYFIKQYNDIIKKHENH